MCKITDERALHNRSRAIEKEVESNK